MIHNTVPLGNSAEGPEMPLGLGMALAQDREAMNRFASFPPERQRAIIDQTHSIESRAEMRSFVEQLKNER